MANTTKLSGCTLQITGLDANWNLDTDMAGTKALKIRSIEFIPSGANDVMIIRNSPAGTATAATIFHVKCADDTDQRIMSFGAGEWFAPCIVIAQCTLSVAASAKVIFTLV